MLNEKDLNEKVEKLLKDQGIEPDMNGYVTVFERTKKEICEKLNVEYTPVYIQENGRSVD